MEHWQPLAAVGNSKGMLQVVNLAKNELMGEYLAHTNQIQFIKWIDQKNLITIGESVLHNDQARFLSTYYWVFFCLTFMFYHVRSWKPMKSSLRFQK